MVWVIFEQSFSGYLGFADGPKYSGKQQRNIIFLCSFSVAQLSYPNTKVVPSTSAIFLFLLFLFWHSQPERQQPGGGERDIYQGEPHTAPGTWDIDWIASWFSWRTVFRSTWCLEPTTQQTKAYHSSPSTSVFFQKPQSTQRFRQDF